MKPRRILLTTFGSLGDLHPFLALAVELRRRGHTPILASLEHHRPHVEAASIEFRLLRTALTDKPDRELIRRTLDLRFGSRFIIRDLVMPALRTAFADTLAAADTNQPVDLLISHPITFATRLVAENRNLPWASTHLAPMSLLSPYDPPAIPGAAFLDILRPLGPTFFRPFFRLAHRGARAWTARWTSSAPNSACRPIPTRSSPAATHLPSSSRSFRRCWPRSSPDWPAHTVVTGFPFYNQPSELPEKLAQFLAAGDPPIVFTLGSSAVHDAGDFFRISAQAAQLLNRRAILLTGSAPENLPPKLPPAIAAFDYAPYAQLFPHAAAIVHQGGVGTTAEAIRAGRPMLVMPYSVDQPDNAAPRHAPRHRPHHPAQGLHRTPCRPASRPTAHPRLHSPRRGHRRGRSARKRRLHRLRRHRIPPLLTSGSVDDCNISVTPKFNFSPT